MAGSDELSQLMPRIHQQAHVTSPGNTLELRHYMMAAGTRAQPFPLGPSNPPRLSRRAQLQLRPGTGRVPQKRPFTLDISVEDLEVERRRLQEETAQLDPEELKHALLQQAKQQRRAALQAVLRPGGKRQHVRRPFTLVLDPVMLPEPEPEPELTGITPGQMLVASQPQAQASSQLGTAKTPASSLGRRYTPMEGVPERLLLLTTRARAPPATLSRSELRQQPGTPFGFTPMEGIPERLHRLSAQRQLLSVGRTRIHSNDEQQQHLQAGQTGVDSPVEGLVQEAARRAPSPRPVDAEAAAAEVDEEFAFALGPEDAADDDEDVEGGALEEHAAAEEPSPSGRSPGGFPFLAGGLSPVHVAEAAVQTGRSLQAHEHEEEAGQADAAGVAEEAAAEEAGAMMLDDHCNIREGFEYDDDAGAPAEREAYLPEQQDGPEAWQQQQDAAPDDCLQQDEAEEPAVQPARQRRRNTHTGARLRNELGKRKSLAARSDIGMHEVAPGVRRSTRTREQPLKWWLNESKEYSREHRTMPTVRDVRHVNPNTPWRMVADPMASFKRKKKVQRAPTPHELDLTGQQAEEERAAAEAEEDAAGLQEQPHAVEAAVSDGMQQAELQQVQAGAAEQSDGEHAEQEQPAAPAAKRRAMGQSGGRSRAAKSKPAAAKGKKKRRR